MSLLSPTNAVIKQQRQSLNPPTHTVSFLLHICWKLLS